MKLISKHIVTVHDLIVDERAEHILQLCSINTLVALTDKIFEFALLWCAKTCDKEDDDWNNQNESEENQLPNMDDLPITDDDFFISKNIRFAATGGFINAEIASKMTTMESLGLEKYPGGRLSRLFNLAFEKLLKNYELCRTASGIVLTRLELRTAKNDSFLTRKIYITPSTILYEGPYCEEKCAVTREYVQYQDRFLRLTFRDEAFSSSQLREHSCWMFASPDDRTTVDIIREWMGDFRNVHPIAKLAARLGQSFSTSIKGIQLESHQIKEISDERRSTTEINGIHEYCFTDGIGIISLTLAKRLARTMKLPETVCPCAFQIRCGGYKGMVCLDVAGKINNPNIDVYFRESMNKFAAKTLSIDVIRTSLHPTVAYLNRQIILLLSSLGIGDQIFLSLQSDMLKMLKALEGNFLEACETLKKLSNFDENGYHGFLIAYLKHLREQRDPFVRQLIRVIRTSLVKELRTKAKIFVPNSWSLLGVVDESRTLNYGEVFIQIDSSNEQRDESTGKIFRGPVVVTRNPCFHPGDIRKLTAVNVPALHSLKNVIVFPMNGPRAHPAEMSGGDLDGDTFWISRHPDLIFKENEDPFDYQDQDHEANKMQTTNDVQHMIEDVCNFFGEYIAADNLGLIANSHLALSDQLEDGVRNKNCLQLAKMHSVAVDFAKKGVNAPHLTKELRPSQYPHFMEKNDKPTYHSKSILGQLHDKIPFYGSDIHIDEEEEIRATSSFPYKSFFIAGDKNYIKDARIIKGEYDRDILRIMRQYGIQNEAEIVSGCLLKFTSKQYAKETKIFDLRNEITHAYKVIRDKYLTLFWKEFYQVTDESDEEKVSWSEISKKLSWKNQVDIYEYYNQMTLSDAVKQKASAWFHTTYEPWIKRIETYRKIKNKKQNKSMDNQRTKQFTRFNGLFSFACSQNMLPSTFETLPDEILMIIIRYSGDIYTIFRTFSGVNQRINNILVDKRMHLLTDFLCMDITDVNIDYYYKSEVFDDISQQLLSLTITENDQQFRQCLQSLIVFHIKYKYKQSADQLKSNIKQFQCLHMQLTDDDANNFDMELAKTFKDLKKCSKFMNNIKRIESLVVIKGAKLTCPNNEYLDFNFAEAVNLLLLDNIVTVSPISQRFINSIIQMFKVLVISNLNLLHNRAYVVNGGCVIYFFLFYLIYRCHAWNCKTSCTSFNIQYYEATWIDSIVDLFKFISPIQLNIDQEIFVYTSQIEILKIVLDENILNVEFNHMQSTRYNSFHFSLQRTYDKPIRTWLTTNTNLLFILLEKKECKLVKQLLNLSPSFIHRLDEDGNDPLLYVCLKVCGCRHRLIEYLIRMGSDLRRRNLKDENVFDVLQLKRNRNLLEILIEHDII
ncbi:unnamed protein product [Rotaria sordida]|uniref:RNA-dependent RNA polymerase n=1 Tax=Rotaria sordida TaxID=392033 RepID=A0A814WJV1_9BILA|nr:unnamed protein product [Rotaria sordida]